MFIGMGWGIFEDVYGYGGFTPANLPNLALWLDPTYGVYTDGAASFDGNVANYLSATNTAFTIPTGGVLTVSCFAYPETTTSFDYSHILGVRGTYPTNIQWLVGQDYNNMGWRAYLRAGGADQEATVSGAVNVNTWYHLLVEYNDIAKTITFWINNGTPGTVSYSGTPATATVPFTVGADLETGGPATFDGNVDSLGIWNRALTANERAALYNGGNGTTYAGLPTSLLNGLTSWYDLNEATGTRYDSQGTNNLTMNGSVGVGAGIAEGMATDGSPVSLWIDHLGNVFSQPTYANRPIFNAGSGKPYLSFNGVNQYLTGPAYVASTGGASVAMALQPTQTSTVTVPMSNVSLQFEMQFIQGTYLSFRQIQDTSNFIGRRTVINFINANTWYNSVNNWNGGTANASIALYLSDVEVDAVDDSNGVFTAPNTSAIPTIIGAQNASGIVNYFQGNISTVVRTGSSLTASQIGQLSSFLAGTHA